MSPRTPAPRLTCAACGRVIGRKRTHYLLEGDRVICPSCLVRRDRHREIFPECPHAWHDLLDHSAHVSGTRAGIAHALGLWPVPKHNTTQERKA